MNEMPDTHEQSVRASSRFAEFSNRRPTRRRQSGQHRRVSSINLRDDDAVWIPGTAYRCTACLRRFSIGPMLALASRTSALWPCHLNLRGSLHDFPLRVARCVTQRHHDFHKGEITMLSTIAAARPRPSQFLAALLATLTLTASLFVVPAATSMPAALSSLDISPAAAHTEQYCTTTYTYSANGVPRAHTTCVNVEHNHPVRTIIGSFGAGLACGVLAGAATGGLGAFVGAAACGSVAAVLLD